MVIYTSNQACVVLNSGDVKADQECVAMHPHGIFYYGRSALTSREYTIRNCIQCVHSNWIRISFSKRFLLFATKPCQSKKCLLNIFQCIRNKLQLLR